MKGWKKVKTRRGLSRWENDAGRWIYVTATTDLRGERIYQVDSNHPKYYSNATMFGTREKALAHAKDFMQRHPEASAGDIIFNQGVDLKTMRK